MHRVCSTQVYGRTLSADGFGGKRFQKVPTETVIGRWSQKNNKTKHTHTRTYIYCTLRSVRFRHSTTKSTVLQLRVEPSFFSRLIKTYAHKRYCGIKRVYRPKHGHGPKWSLTSATVSVPSNHEY